MTLETSSPHHGVVIALADHFVVSIPGPTSEDLPIGVEVRHDDDEVVATFAECPEMHGEAASAKGVLLASLSTCSRSTSVASSRGRQKIR